MKHLNKISKRLKRQEIYPEDYWKAWEDNYDSALEMAKHTILSLEVYENKIY